MRITSCAWFLFGVAIVACSTQEVVRTSIGASKANQVVDGDAGDAGDAGPDPSADAASSTQGDAAAVDLGIHPEVGLLVVQGDGGAASTCTGTLVRTAATDAHNVVISARTCRPDIDSFYIGAGSAQPLSGGDVNQALLGMKRYHVAKSVTTGIQDQNGVDNATCPHEDTLDVRIYLLGQDVADVAPATISRQAPDRNTACELVGFGPQSTDGGASVQFAKRSIMPVLVDNVLSYNLSQVAVSSGAPALGDTGGPLFCNGNMVASDSCGHGSDPAAQTDAFYARIDIAYDAIDQVIQAWANVVNSPAAPSDAGGDPTSDAGVGSADGG